MAISAEQLRSIKDRSVRREMIGKPSFEEIDLLFEKFKAPLKGGRGGIIAPYKHPIRRDSQKVGNIMFQQDPTYHVEMSWTEQQDYYADVALLNLEDLVQGVGRNKESVISFSKRVEQKTLQKLQGDESSFSTALFEATLDLLRDYAKIYPEWMPAMNAIFTIAGAEGIEIVLDSSTSFLDDALRGILNHENIATYENSSVALQHFAARHPNNDVEPDRYEIQCTGRTLARKLFVQSRIAGLNSSKDPFVRENYVRTQDGHPSNLYIYQQLRDHVQDLYHSEQRNT